MLTLSVDSEALRQLENVSEEERVGTWRRFVGHNEPKQPTRFLDVLRQVLTKDFGDLPQIIARVELSKLLVMRYTHPSARKSQTVCSKRPFKLTLALHTSQLASFDKVVEELPERLYLYVCLFLLSLETKASLHVKAATAHKNASPVLERLGSTCSTGVRLLASLMPSLPPQPSPFCCSPSLMGGSDKSCKWATKLTASQRQNQDTRRVAYANLTALHCQKTCSRILPRV